MQEERPAARRGGALREHILYAAKDVFLEMGFERASMDAIAERAGTSKRTLYAHFESKEKLFFAIIDVARAGFSDRLKQPGDYSGDPVEALTLFCARLLQMMHWAPVVRMWRMSIAEVDRFPEGATAYYNAMFPEIQDRLSDYLRTAFALSPKAAASAAQELLGKLMYPAFPRLLFGLEPLEGTFDERATGIDLKPIRKLVCATIATFGS
jgi:AcrR family transcriptional regulator